MTDTTPESRDRPEGFPEAVASKFAFLLDRGFRFSVETDESVLYEAPNGVFVRVFRDARDRYVGFRAGLVTRPRDALTVPEFTRLTGATTKGEYPENTSELLVTVERLARLLDNHGERVLSGDESILDEAMALRREYTKSFTRAESPNEQHDTEN